MKTSQFTRDSGALQKGCDFVEAFMLGSPLDAIVYLYPPEAFERDPSDLPSDGDRTIRDEIGAELNFQDFITLHLHSNMHNFAFKDVLKEVLK